MDSILCVSKHEAVKEKILELIKSGKLPDDMRLPSEEKLAASLNVSRTTVRSALQSLEDEGVIVKKHGIGNFVQPERHPMSEKLSFERAAHVLLGQPVYGDFSSTIEIADPKTCQALGLPSGSEVVVLNKVMVLKGVRSSIIKEHFPAELIKHIPKVEEIPNSIYEFAERYCNVYISKAIAEITPVAAAYNPFGKENGPCLLFEEQFLSATGTPIAFSYLYMNTNIIHPQFSRG